MTSGIVFVDAHNVTFPHGVFKKQTVSRSFWLHYLLDVEIFGVLCIVRVRESLRHSLSVLRASRWLMFTCRSRLPIVRSLRGFTPPMVHRPHLLRLYGYRGLGLLDNVCRQTAVALYFYTLIAVHPQRLLDNSESVRCADMAWRVEQRTCLRNLPPVSAITLIYVHL